MKKNVVVVGIIILMAGSSCKKNRTCQCVYTDGDVETSIIVNESKKGAKNICNAMSSSNRDCSLK